MLLATAVAAIVAVNVVVKVIVWDESIGKMILVVEMLTIGVLGGVEIIVAGAIVIVLKFALPVSYFADASSSAVAVDLFMDALPGVTLAVLAGMGVGVLTGADANVFIFAMTALEFPVPTPLEECSRWTVFKCWSLALLDCAHISQTWMPSCHEGRSLALPALPQFLNQEPPRPQQLRFPDFAMTPHLHSGLMVVILVTTGG